MPQARVLRGVCKSYYPSQWVPSVFARPEFSACGVLTRGPHTRSASTIYSLSAWAECPCVVN